MSTATVQGAKIVSQEEWLAARKQLLAKEKKLTRERDALAAEGRKLPWSGSKRTTPSIRQTERKLWPRFSTAEARS